LQPSFYITEAAKRIRYHHIQTHCFAIIPPSSLLVKHLPARSCNAIRTHTLAGKSQSSGSHNIAAICARALNHRCVIFNLIHTFSSYCLLLPGLDYDCVFIALLSSGGVVPRFAANAFNAMSPGKRSAVEVQKLVESSRIGGIKRVFTLSEGKTLMFFPHEMLFVPEMTRFAGVFPYPLDDLWAMRTHAMVQCFTLRDFLTCYNRRAVSGCNGRAAHYGSSEGTYRRF